MTVPAGVIVAWPSSAASIPLGWARAAALDGVHVRGYSATDPGALGGATSHIHTAAAHGHTFPTHSHENGTVAAPSAQSITGATTFQSVLSNHAHGVPVAGTAAGYSTSSDVAGWAGTLNDPSYLSVVWIRSDGTPAAFPAWAVAYWNSSTLPPGWQQHPGGKSAYLKGAATGSDGGVAAGGNQHTHRATAHTHTGGSSHTHTGGPTLPSLTVPTVEGVAAGGGATADNIHTHTVTVNFTVADCGQATPAACSGTDAEPPYISLAIIQNTSGALSWPLNLIALWIDPTASIPAGWVVCNGGSGTPNTTSNFVRGCNLLSEIGNTGGGTSHAHTGTAHVHPSAHTHGLTVASDASSTGPSDYTSTGPTIDSYTHGHGATQQSGVANPNASTSTVQTVATSTVETRPPFFDVAFIQYQASATVSVTTPSGSVATPEFAAAWVLSGSRVQATYRVQVATDAGMTNVVYDSGVVTSATQGATVPAAPSGPPYPARYGLVNGTTYYFQVTTIDVSSVASQSTVVAFTATWTAPTVPSGLAVASNTAALPYHAASWSQVTPLGGDSFSHYNLYRSPHGAGSYTRIAVVQTVTTVGYADYNAQPGASYDYVLSATYTRGGFPIESALSGVVTHTLAFTGLYLHDAANPAFFMQWLGSASTLDRYQAQTMVQGWGRQTPTAYIGEAENTRYQLDGALDVPHANQANWIGILALLSRQRANGSVLLYRNGVTNQADFVVISGEQRRASQSGSMGTSPIARKDTLTSTKTTITLIPVSFQEAV